MIKDISEKLEALKKSTTENAWTLNQEWAQELFVVLDSIIAEMKRIPDWVTEHQCCPPGMSCCNCD